MYNQRERENLQLADNVAVDGVRHVRGDFARFGTKRFRVPEGGDETKCIVEKNV